MPISFHKDTVDERHTPADPRNPFQDVLDIPFHVSDSFELFCEEENEGDVRHVLMVADHHGVFRFWESVSGDVGFNAAYVREMHTLSPPEAGQSSVYRTKRFFGKWTYQHAQALQKIDEEADAEQIGERDSALQVSLESLCERFWVF